MYGTRTALDKDVVGAEDVGECGFVYSPFKCLSVAVHLRADPHVQPAEALFSTYLGRMAGHYKGLHGVQTCATQKCLLFLCSDLSANLPMYARSSGQCPEDILCAMNCYDGLLVF